MEKSPPARFTPLITRGVVLVLVLIAPLAVLMLLAPSIPQDPRYHSFADTRTLLGIPNFGNVASNLAFLLIGAAGLLLCIQRKAQGAVRSWTAFFGGVVLIALGSAFYHWIPNNATLVWDRLPMTVAFMALFIALLSEHVSGNIERKGLVPAILIGIGSVLWWRYTGDLRLYVWVQFAPLLAIPVMISAWPARYSHRHYLLYALLAYALAKLAELADGAILSTAAGVISGHALKHLTAALAPLFVYLMLRVRKPLALEAGASPTARGARPQTPA